MRLGLWYAYVPTKTQFTLVPINNDALSKLCGDCDEHLHYLSHQHQLEIHNRGHQFYLKGEEQTVFQVVQFLCDIYGQYLDNNIETSQQFYNLHQNLMHGRQMMIETILQSPIGDIQCRNPAQQYFCNCIENNHVTFGVGPAGTGKTFLAVALAVKYLITDRIGRIVLVRPVVEAGERLGFLPGDINQKIDPYLKPLYDALHDLLGSARLNKLTERGQIEMVPLAYMRGRTLNDAFIILDEAQNCTQGQMKMFLTRIGFGSKMVITGDITQIDLPDPKFSALPDALMRLKNIKGVGFCHFSQNDIVRHPLIQAIVNAYSHEQQHTNP